LTRRQEIIATLLEWYQDVLESWQDGTASDSFGFPRVNAILRHPSYQELERLLPMLRAEEPEVYWNVTQRYVYAPTKCVLRCVNCGPSPNAIAYGLLHPRDELQRPDGQIRFHQHGRKIIQLRPVRVRNPSKAIRPELIERGIVWIDDHFAIEPFVPDFEGKPVAA
jgi:hypothetical protein